MTCNKINLEISKKYQSYDNALSYSDRICAGLCEHEGSSTLCQSLTVILHFYLHCMAPSFLHFYLHCMAPSFLHFYFELIDLLIDGTQDNKINVISFK